MYWWIWALVSILSLTKGVVCVLSHVWLFGTPWTVAPQAPWPMEFSRQKYWSEESFPSSGYLPDPGIKLRSLCLLHWQADSLQVVQPRSPCQRCNLEQMLHSLSLCTPAPISAALGRIWSYCPSSPPSLTQHPPTSHSTCCGFCETVKGSALSNTTSHLGETFLTITHFQIQLDAPSP